jgi:hypothetical protein
MKKLVLLSLLAGLILGHGVLHAQTTQASISGTVTDQPGTPLVGATVQVKNESTGLLAPLIIKQKGSHINHVTACFSV